MLDHAGLFRYLFQGALQLVIIRNERCAFAIIATGTVFDHQRESVNGSEFAQVFQGRDCGKSRGRNPSVFEK